MEELLSKIYSRRSERMSIQRHIENRVNIFLVSCSPAKLNYASIDGDNCKPMLGPKSKCKFVAGLTVKFKNNCKLISGRVND